MNWRNKFVWLIMWLNVCFSLFFSSSSFSSSSFQLSRAWTVSVKRHFVRSVKWPQDHQPLPKLRLKEQKPCQKIFIQISIGLKSSKRSSRWVSLFLLSVLSLVWITTLFHFSSQEPNGIPVHLKGGAKDKALYYTTVVLIAIGLAGCAEFVYHLP